MATIPEMTRKWKSVQLEREVPVIFKQTEFEALSLNKTQLYNFGVDSDGKKLERYNSKSYAKEKNFDNPRPGFGVPDLFVTGAFYEGFYMKVTPTSVIFDSRDVKANRLENLFGYKIYGLTKDNKRVYLDTTVWPMIRAYVSRQTGLRFT